MKTRFALLLVKTILAGALLIGLILVWASLQSFESLASLVNRLASDGELEAFTVSIYQHLKLPFALVGIFLVALASFLLIQWWKKTAWVT